MAIASSIHSDKDYSKTARAYLDQAVSISNRNGKTKPGISNEDRRWSTAAMKDDSLTERLLDSDDTEASLHRSTSTDALDETERA